jgi:hypothetical protein
LTLNQNIYAFVQPIFWACEISAILHDAMTSHPAISSIFDSPVFQIANAQYLRACSWPDVPQDAMERTRLPKRALVMQVPVRMDDGTLRSFEGYRVQHHLALGPTKGGVRFHPGVTLGETAALAMWMSWKCALGWFALWRSERRGCMQSLDDE